MWGKMEGDREVRRRLSVTSNNNHNNNLFMLGVCMYVCMFKNWKGNRFFETVFVLFFVLFCYPPSQP